MASDQGLEVPCFWQLAMPDSDQAPHQKHTTKLPWRRPAADSESRDGVTESEQFLQGRGRGLTQAVAATPSDSIIIQ